MPRKTIEKEESIEEKLEYLGLDLDNIPEAVKKFEDLEYRIPKFYDENQYKQYRYIPIKDIQILLSPTNRMDEMSEKYKKASPVFEYLDNKSEKNIVKHTIFLNMLKQCSIKKIEEIEEEQEKLNKKIPFKVKYEGNYLWQIYYSENADKYFMLVPTGDSDYSTFFFLLKKQLEKRKTGRIFAPVRNVEYSSNYFKKTEIEDIVNYLWLFTKDWPLVYEVYDKNDELTLQFIGETQVYDKIKSSYRIKIGSKEEANKFYKLIKAMFILQSELPKYFHFRTDIGRNGEIEFYIEDEKIEYEGIGKWLREEYLTGVERTKVAKQLIKENNKKIENLKLKVVEQEIEYLAKEKQISTYLECKKTFFGKFKYYFKYNKKQNEKDIKKERKIEETDFVCEEKEIKENDSKKQRQNYTIEEILELYKNFEELETSLKKLVMDVNSLKLKSKNLDKKIENATQYIQEIDKHKKSIFEFWKFSNKDELAVLPEGEQEEVNIIKKITKVFDYEEDFEEFGKKMDKVQRKVLSKEEVDSVFMTTTNVLQLLNKIKNNTITPKEIEEGLKDLKKEAIQEKALTESEDFDIFGGMSQDSTKISKIKNKTHRELKKDKFSILELNKNTKQIGFKLNLEKIIENVEEALQKVTLPENITIYKAVTEQLMDKRKINIFNINPEIEIEQALQTDKSKINFYKINLKEGINAISYTNSIFFDNQNKTLPIGQDLSSNILVDMKKLELELKEKVSFKVAKIVNEEDDFSKVAIKNINVFEFEVKNSN